jgi:hypothetical protein
VKEEAGRAMAVCRWANDWYTPAKNVKYTPKWTPSATLPYFLYNCFILPPEDSASLLLDS